MSFPRNMSSILTWKQESIRHSCENRNPEVSEECTVVKKFCFLSKFAKVKMGDTDVYN